MPQPKSSARHRKPAKNAAKNAAKRPAASAAEPINFGPLADWTGFRLRMAQAASFQAFSRRSQDVGENPGRFATLMLIGENPGISQTTLSRANGRDKSSLTPVLEDLVRRGLVQRARTRDDRRTNRLKLSQSGEKTLAKLTECARQHEQNLDRLIGARERTRFLDILRKIAAEIG